ncbi:Protein argonaute-3-like protein, partial [Leptotrombidium deliense]
ANLGVTMSNAYPIKHRFQSTEILKENVFKRIMDNPKRRDVQLIVFIFPSGQEADGAVKYLGDTIFGVPTQCLSIEKYNSLLSPSYLGNVMLKINAKLNGIKLHS